MGVCINRIGTDGTSFAAPMVAGGLALMKQLFRDQIPNADLVERLFLTADKEGPYAAAEIYGQGMMYLGAATSPVGPATLAFGKSVDTRGYSLSNSVIRTGRAFGDGLARSFAGRQIVAFDRLGAPFWYGLSNFTDVRGGPATRARLARLLSGMASGRHDLARRTPPLSSWSSAGGTPGRPGRGLRLGIMDVPFSAGDSHLSLAEGAVTWSFDDGGGLNAGALMTPGDVRRAPVAGLAMSYRPSEASAGVRAGWLAESETLLGTETGGGFGRIGADAMFAGFDAALGVGTWQFLVDAEIGVVAPHPGDGLTSRMSRLTTTSFALRGRRRIAGHDSPTLMVSQPLRVEAGEATFLIPDARTRAGEVLRSSLRADLAPSGREINYSAQWNSSLAGGGNAVVDLTWTRDPGHRAQAKTAASLLAGWRVEF